MWAQDYEEYEDEVVTTRRKNKVLTPNSIPQNPKCKFSSEVASLIIFSGEGEKKRDGDVVRRNAHSEKAEPDTQARTLLEEAAHVD